MPYPDSQFPPLPLKRNYVEQFGASFVPYVGTSDIAMVKNHIMSDLTTDSIEALLDDIGPSVIVLHSAAGTGGFAAAIADEDRVKAVVAIETTMSSDARAARQDRSNVQVLGIITGWLTEHGI